MAHLEIVEVRDTNNANEGCISDIACKEQMDRETWYSWSICPEPNEDTEEMLQQVMKLSGRPREEVENFLLNYIITFHQLELDYEATVEALNLRFRQQTEAVDDCFYASLDATANEKLTMVKASIDGITIGFALLVEGDRVGQSERDKQNRRRGETTASRRAQGLVQYKRQVPKYFGSSELVSYATMSMPVPTIVYEFASWLNPDLPSVEQILAKRCIELSSSPMLLTPMPELDWRKDELRKVGFVEFGQWVCMARGCQDPGLTWTMALIKR